MIDNNAFDGLTRREVTGMLGPPDSEYDHEGRATIAYVTGPARGFMAIFIDLLAIEFEEDETVARVYFMRD